VVHCSPAVTRYSSSGKSSVEGKMGLKHIGDEKNRIRQILACPGARMNPELADTLAYNSSVSASVAIGVLASVRPATSRVASVTQTVPLVTPARRA
jgi:hypothetical protein